MAGSASATSSTSGRPTGIWSTAPLTPTGRPCGSCGDGWGARANRLGPGQGVTALAMLVRAVSFGFPVALNVATQPAKKPLLLFFAFCSCDACAGCGGLARRHRPPNRLLLKLLLLRYLPLCLGSWVLGFTAVLVNPTSWLGLLLFRHAGPGVQAPGGGLGAKPPIQSSWP
jgi:hypothetical protein